jgi:hypothetical protein
VDKERRSSIRDAGEDDGIEKPIFHEGNMSRCDNFRRIGIRDQYTVLLSPFVTKEATFQCPGVDLVCRFVYGDICHAAKLTKMVDGRYSPEPGFMRGDVIWQR